MSRLLGCDRCAKTVEGSISQNPYVEAREGKEPTIRYGAEEIYVSGTAGDKGFYDSTKGWRFLTLPANGSECAKPRLLMCPACVKELHDFCKPPPVVVKP